MRYDAVGWDAMQSPARFIPPLLPSSPRSSSHPRPPHTHTHTQPTPQLALPIYQIDVERNLIFVEGHVPGNVGSSLRVRDTVKEAKYPVEEDNLPPVPTHFTSWDEQEEDGMEANVGSAVVKRADGETLLIARQPENDPNDLAAAYEAAGMKRF